MDRSRIHKAAMLLAKADSTDSDAEAAALLLRSYGLIADTLSAYQSEQGEAQEATRRRERRLVRDRRATRRPSDNSAEVETATEQNNAATAYGRFGDGTARKRRIDLPL